MKQTYLVSLVSCLAVGCYKISLLICNSFQLLCKWFKLYYSIIVEVVPKCMLPIQRMVMMTWNVVPVILIDSLHCLRVHCSFLVCYQQGLSFMMDR